MLQIQRDFYKKMHESKFGRDGSFLIVLKKHYVLFVRSVGHAAVQNRSSKSSRLSSCKVRDNSVRGISCSFFTPRWFKSLFWEFRRDGSFCYGFVGETPEFDWNRTTSSCCTLEQSRHALRHA